MTRPGTPSVVSKARSLGQRGAAKEGCHNDQAEDPVPRARERRGNP